MTPSALSVAHVVVGDHAAADDQDVVGAALLQQLQRRAENRHVRAGQDADADDVDVFLDRGLDDLLGRAVQAGVDDVHAGVAQRARDDLDAAVVAVEPDFGDEDADRISASGLHRQAVRGRHPYCRFAVNLRISARRGPVESGIVSGLNSSGKPVPAARSACTPATVRMSVTRQSRRRLTSIETTSPTRSSG